MNWKKNIPVWMFKIFGKKGKYKAFGEMFTGYKLFGVTYFPSTKRFDRLYFYYCNDDMTETIIG